MTLGLLVLCSFCWWSVKQQEKMYSFIRALLWKSFSFIFTVFHNRMIKILLALLSKPGWNWSLGSTYPVISLSMTIFCRPVDRLLLGRLGEPTRSVGDDTGTPVGFVRAEFTSRRIRARGPSLVIVLYNTMENELWLTGFKLDKALNSLSGGLNT